MTNPRQFILSTGIKIFLGKNAENNDELVNKFKGKPNVILHTEKPGSPFCIMDSENPSNQEIKQAAIICAAKSQAWRDTKNNVEVHKFTGKNVKKPLFSKQGSWKLTIKPETIKVNKKEIKQWLENYNSANKE